MNGVKVDHDLVGNDMLLLFDLAEKQLSQSLNGWIWDETNLLWLQLRLSVCLRQLRVHSH